MQSQLVGPNRSRLCLIAFLILLMIPLGCSNNPVESGNGGVTPVQWYRQNPDLTGDNLYDVTMVGQKAWIVGDGGTILYSDDGGLNWRQQGTPTRKCLRAVCFRDQLTGWAVGDSGVILHTSDGGRRWGDQSFPWGYSYSSVAISSRGNGWAVGDLASAYTTDGGQTWSPSTLFSGHVVTFVNSDLGFVISTDGRISRSIDGGKTWSDFAQVSGILHIGSAAFLNDEIGIAAGTRSDNFSYDEVVWKTEDGGKSWSPSNFGVQVSSVAFDNRGNIYALSPDRISVSTDTCKSWAIAESSPRDFQAIDFSSDGTGIVAGLFGGIFRTDTRNQSWQEVSKGSHNSLSDVAALTPLHAWAVSSRGAYETTDGGFTWERNSQVVSPVSVQFRDSLLGWMIGRNGGLFVTHDGGANWSNRSAEPGVPISDAFFLDSATGWLLESQNLWQTIDGGSSWVSRNSLGLSSYSDIWFIDGMNGWVVGPYMPIRRTIDGGSTWTALAGPPHSKWLFKTVFSDTGNGWALGDAGVLYHTVDGGSSWAPLALDGIGPVIDMSFPNAVDGWVSGWWGGIYTTKDGGTSWAKQETPTLQPLYGISVLDQQHGWAVGGGDEILRLGRSPK